MITPVEKPFLSPLRYVVTGIEQGVYPFNDQPRRIADICDGRGNTIAERVYAEDAAAIVKAVNKSARVMSDNQPRAYMVFFKGGDVESCREWEDVDNYFDGEEWDSRIEKVIEVGFDKAGNPIARKVDMDGVAKEIISDIGAERDDREYHAWLTR